MQISERQVGRAVRTDRWKYSVSAPSKDGWRDPSPMEYEEEFLYDLDSDLHENDNFIKDPDLADVRNEMKALLLDCMSEAWEEPPGIVPPLNGTCTHFHISFQHMWHLK